MNNCTGWLQNNTTGSVIQDIGLDCTKNGGGTSVAGCIPFWDEYGQERSQLKRIRITNFAGLGIGIYGVTTQNGGPFDDIQMASGPGAITSTTTCVEVGGTGLGTSNQPPGMRGIRGLTCTGPSTSPASVGTGVDINAQNFNLSDAHFEDFNVGVEVGSLTSARAVSISNITGGGNAQSVNTMVDISANCATSSGTNCQPFATSNINVQGVYQPSTTSGVVALKDNISSRTTTEATLGTYSLGDGSGLGTASTRPILTTSSSIGNSPNLSATASGPTVTGVQGTTGTLVQMSTGSVASGDLGSFDGNGNLVDSTVAKTTLITTSTCGADTFLNGGSCAGQPTLGGPTPGVTGQIIFQGSASGSGILGCLGATCSLVGSSSEGSFKGYSTTTNCVANSSCGSATAGMASIAAGATTVVVNTSSVTANSEIKLQFDATTGGPSQLNVTCNTGTSTAAPYWVSARTPGTSFTISTSVSPATNPACISWSSTN
jgi:hypothetical protein